MKSIKSFLDEKFKTYLSREQLALNDLRATNPYDTKAYALAYSHLSNAKERINTLVDIYETMGITFIKLNDRVVDIDSWGPFDD
jgi:hypothetical protein